MSVKDNWFYLALKKMPHIWIKPKFKLPITCMPMADFLLGASSHLLSLGLPRTLKLSMEAGRQVFRSFLPSGSLPTFTGWLCCCVLKCGCSCSLGARGLWIISSPPTLPDILVPSKLPPSNTGGDGSYWLFLVATLWPWVTERNILVFLYLNNFLHPCR